jgi:hypothetical protein
VDERGFGQIDHGGDLMGIAQDPGLVLLRFEHLQPCQATEQDEQSQKNERSPKQAQFEPGWRFHQIWRFI